MVSITHHSIHRQELVTPLQPAVPVGHPLRDDARDVDGRVLLLASHHVEAEALFSLRQFDHSGVSVAFAGCKRGNGGLR